MTILGNISSFVAVHLLFNLNFFGGHFIYQSSGHILDSGFTFITWQHAFSIYLAKDCSRL